jgi:hypothetical protein
MTSPPPVLANKNPALEAAIYAASAARAAFLEAWKKLDAAAVQLALQCSYVPDPGIPPLIVTGDKARKEMGADWSAWELAMAECSKLAYDFVPPVVEPEPEPEPDPDLPVPGCPADAVLVPWTFKPVEGAGRPTKGGPGAPYDIIPNWKDGAHLQGFDFQGDPTNNYYASAQGSAGDASNVRVSNAKVHKARKWHARPHKVKGLVVEHVSDIDGPEEHDWYIEPIGGQALHDLCFALKHCRSERSGSQRLQSAQRTEDGVTEAMYIDGGMIVLHNDLCLDHARHLLEGGLGTRQSQAYKVFSAQVGPDAAHRVNRLLKHYVLWQHSELDDRMQKWSHGLGLIGAVKGAVLFKGVARMGSLVSPKPTDPTQTQSHELLRVESFITPNPSGPLLIEAYHFEATSGENGPGIALLDDRPVKVVGCTGNIRLQDANGNKLGMVRDGFERNWSAQAQAICDSIKEAGKAL